MKKSLRVLLVISGACIFSLACTLFAALATPVPVIETSTLVPLPMPTMQVTPLPPPTIQPTATIPLVIINTFTPTPIPSTVTVAVENTPKGDYLNISRSTDNLEYRLGPIASGAYAIGPNDNFLVYCTYGGDVYAAKFGAEYLTLIGSVRKFSAIQRNVPPDLELVIFVNNGRYKVDIREGRFSQNEIIVIPTKFTE
ncbi:MAG: hypothetical protein MUO77_09155 [Anaerolineales bacterium]|nr:hypothetical protein [Anaerolineales bacterium]